MHEIENVEKLLNAGATGKVLGSESNDEMAGFSKSRRYMRSGIMRIPNVAEKPVDHAILEGGHKLPRSVVRKTGNIERAALGV
jgi:hypothetical protein